MIMVYDGDKSVNLPYHDTNSKYSCILGVDI